MMATIDFFLYQFIIGSNVLTNIVIPRHGKIPLSFITFDV